MWTLELDFGRKFVEVAPVARPGNPVGMWTLKIPGRGSISQNFVKSQVNSAVCAFLKRFLFF
jgi:hypothetical protein